jgi:predicted neuraminidase
MVIVDSKKEFIFEEDRDFQSAHASTLLAFPNGDVLAAWFAGSWEKGNDVAIWMAHRSESGWQKPYVIADSWGIPLWTPVLFQRADGRVFLYYKEGKTISQWRTLVKFSDDQGITFSEAKELVNGDIGGRGPVKNKPILLESGAILAPASVEGDLWDCFADISKDQGETWTASSTIPLRRIGYDMVDRVYDKRHCYGKGVIQPCFWESEPNKVHALMRSTSSAIFRSDSTDGGNTWGCAYNAGLPNNNSGIDLVKLANNNLVLAWNPVGNLPNYYKGPRTPLILSYSEDNGQSWNSLLTLEDTQGGFAYPAIITMNNELLLTYTWNRERIVFWKIRFTL